MEKKIKAVIFDLDGVIVSTDDYHYQAWKVLADELNIPFNRQINERLRGVSRKESLEIILEKSDKAYSEEQINVFLEKKNNIYREKLNSLSEQDLLPGVREVIDYLKEHNIPIAIGSSSKNTPKILELIDMDKTFNVVIDGNRISRSKPDPEVFLKAAKGLDIKPNGCLVIEDAEAGVNAGIAAGMTVLAVGAAADNEEATYKLEELTLDFIKKIL